MYSPPAAFMDAVDPVAVHTHMPDDQTLNHSRAASPGNRKEASSIEKVDRWVGPSIHRVGIVSDGKGRACSGWLIGSSVAGKEMVALHTYTERSCGLSQRNLPCLEGLPHSWRLYAAETKRSTENMFAPKSKQTSDSLGLRSANGKPLSPPAATVKAHLSLRTLDCHQKRPTEPQIPKKSSILGEVRQTLASESLTRLCVRLPPGGAISIGEVSFPTLPFVRLNHDIFDMTSSTSCHGRKKREWEYPPTHPPSAGTKPSRNRLTAAGLGFANSNCSCLRR